MENRIQDNNEERKDIYTRKKTQEEDDIIALQHSSRRVWREIEDNRVGHQK